jgi:tetratricopeptide (TPR) repeat protein
VAQVRPKLLWVVVLNPPRIDRDAQFQRAASALVKASLRTLGRLQGIVPLDSVVGSASDGIETKTVAEDLLATTLEPLGNRGFITLRRIRGRDGKALGDPISFTAQIDPQNLQDLEKKIEARLPATFCLHPQRDDVSQEGYAAFFAIKEKVDDGQAASKSELSELAKIIARFPRFLEARLLAAELAVTTYQRSQDGTDRARALQLIRKAERLDPHDPRPLQSEFKLSLVKPQGDEADILSRLEKRALGNPQIPALRAVLAEKQGNLSDALINWRKAKEYDPSWRNLLGLAKIEEELGSVEGARSHLKQILADSPGNPYALRRLAELELDYGDPAKAESIYRNVIGISPTSIDYAGLGTARVLLRHYAGAIQAFQQALKLSPRDEGTMLNLADAELAQGHAEKAEDHYRRVCQKTAEDMIKAQCLAHLGRPQEAEEIVKNALQQNPDNPDVIRSAALVYTLAGHSDLALERSRMRVPRA